MSEPDSKGDLIKGTVDRLFTYTSLKSSLILFGFTNRVIVAVGGWDALSDINKAAATALFSSGIVLLITGVNIATKMKNNNLNEVKVNI